MAVLDCAATGPLSAVMHTAAPSVSVHSPSLPRPALPRRKNKFCMHCNGKCGDLYLPVARVCGLKEELHDVLVNSSESGVWSAAPAALGSARFRVINNTAVSIILVAILPPPPPSPQFPLFPPIAHPARTPGAPRSHTVRHPIRAQPGVM